MKAALFGTTGYTGMVLLRLLAGHPEVTDIIPASSSKAGEAITSIDPGLSEPMLGKTDLCGRKLVPIEDVGTYKPDVVFAALPHLNSGPICKQFFGSSVVIDLSADFRIHNALLFSKAYGEYPPCPEYLDQAVYGLCEVYREDIKNSDIVANPGCYPTATLLPLAPLLAKNMITGRIIVNALSGISGAGKKIKENLLFCERSENTGAYAPGSTHRHVTEIQQEIDLLTTPKKAEQSLGLLFTPHLVPLKRGMAVTTAVELTESVDTTGMLTLFQDYYAGSSFIKLLSDRLPQSGDVWGSNRCDIGWHLEENSALLFSTIDNLMKGASGQAIQNMNIRFGIDEQVGLPMEGAV